MATKIKVKDFSVRKWEGDDLYSWAVFRKADTKGRGGGVLMGTPAPIVSGCSRREAENYAAQFQREHNEKQGG